jgi:outer membrane protein insertion porin family
MNNPNYIITPLFILIALCSSICGQQPTTKMRVGHVEVKGVRLLKEAEVVVASGLKVGDEIDGAALDAAAERLLATGLFSKLGCHVREVGGVATVTFDVVEAPRGGDLPVVFDNFPWFTREELTTAVRRELPTFEGRAAQTKLATEAVKRGLEKLLRERGIPGEVDYMLSTTELGGSARMVFAVKGAPAATVCAVSYPGAAGVSGEELAATSQSLVGDAYSHEVVAGFADSAVRQLYHERGYLRVEFGEPRPIFGGGAGACKGVSVEVPVREGAAYAWAGAEWAGNTALAADALDTALGMKPGEVANAKKIGRALGSVAKAYGRRGYLALSVRPEQQFDEAARRVTYRFEVREGPQFRMGTLAVTGLSESDAERVKSKWRLKPGDVYDAGYFPEFLAVVARDLYRPGGRPPRAAIEVKPDRQRAVADVTLKFGVTPQTPEP